MKKYNQEQFLEKAILIHNNKYDYSLSEYVDARSKIKIICKIHGVFLQKAGQHLFGIGCSNCAGNQKKTLNNFILNAKTIHKNKYDYSKSNYVNTHTKLEIICNNCNQSFWQIPKNHIVLKQGCKNCSYKELSINKRKNINNFINEANKIHHNKYRYDLIYYKNNKTKIEIICNKCENIFQQNPKDHLNGNGCPNCCHVCISKPETQWLDSLNIKQKYRQYPIKINNKTYKADGYCPETNTIYEFLGDFWHGNPKKFKLEDINPIIKKSFRELYDKTIDKINLYKQNGYNIIYIWESDFHYD